MASSLSDGAIANAFDDPAGLTIWASGSALPDWIGYVFAASKNIIQVAVKARATGFNQSPKDFTIDYWDVNHWETAHTVTGETGWTSSEIRTFTFGSGAVAARPVVFITT